MTTAKRKWGPEPHNFGKPLGYAVVAPCGMLDGGAHTFRGDAQRVLDYTDCYKARPYGEHRIVELWPAEDASDARTREIEHLRSTLQAIAENGGNAGWDGASCSAFARDALRPNARIKGGPGFSARPF